MQLSQNNIGERPIISFFFQKNPFQWAETQEAVYDTSARMNMTEEGIPFFMAGRSSKPPTSCSTPGHTVKSGYTPSGKWKPSKYVPSKTDKRAGK
jgi:hypothetical protein